MDKSLFKVTQSDKKGFSYSLLHFAWPYYQFLNISVDMQFLIIYVEIMEMVLKFTELLYSFDAQKWT